MIPHLSAFDCPKKNPCAQTIYKHTKKIKSSKHILNKKDHPNRWSYSIL